MDINYQILLYYKYIAIKDPEELLQSQIKICKELGFKGRILMSSEGINGTLEGTTENTEKYISEMSKDERFKDIHWKKSIGTGNAFPKLSIRIRKEIVSGHLGEWDINPSKTTGKYLSPEELNKWINEKKEIFIVDMRNDYEHKVGHFEGSILPKLSNFRDLPTILPELESLKDKTIVTVCTGGVRCEKASGFLLNNGFKDVYQLQGGIVSYMEKYPNKDFKGKLYVFDGRIIMGFNTDQPDHEIIGKCDKCGNQSENYVNCANMQCHDHFICCENCLSQDGKAYCGKC